MIEPIGLILLDLDDTTGNTTKDLRGDFARVDFLTPVPGAEKFLLRWKGKTGICTAGREEEQKKKLQRLGLLELISFFWVVSTPAQKEEQFQRVAAQFNGHASQVVAIGDRLVSDIAPCNRVGFTTVRMQLPHGKYSHEVPDPKDPYQRPDITVQNFLQLMDEHERFR